MFAAHMVSGAAALNFVDRDFDANDYGSLRSLFAFSFVLFFGRERILIVIIVFVVFLLEMLSRLDENVVK
jgi:hypothetical protein